MPPYKVGSWDDDGDFNSDDGDGDSAALGESVWGLE
jgi:hypothetical protein